MILFEALDTSTEHTVLGEYNIEGFEFSIVESAGVIGFSSKVAKSLTKFSDFKASHEFFLGTGVPLGLTAINAYSKNKTQTAKLFAKTAWERHFYGRIVQDLLKAGTYKVSKRYTNGGIMFELERTKK